MTRHLIFVRAIKIAFISVLLVASHAYGFSSYYVSSLGNDASDGKSTSTSWKTLSKVNAFTFVSGDAVYFRSGDTFNGQINVNQSGLTFGSYGGSVKPIVSGAVSLTGWSVHSGSIYKAQASAFVKNLYSNSVQMTLARYPNTGFLTTTSTNGSTTLVASGLNQASGYWNGGNVRIRTTAYTYETHPISSYDGSTITLVSRSSWSYPLSTGYGFYLDNKLAALDAANEWFCDPLTNMVYFYAPGGVNPASLSIDGSTTDYGINTAQSNVLVQDLDFRYQAVAAFNFSGTTSNNRILSNTIFDQMVQAILVMGTSSNYTIDGNTMQNLGGRGIYCQNTSSTTISNNTMKSIGLVPGYGIDMEGGMTGIVIDAGSHYVIRGNIIDSTGYTGICSNGSYNLVENNVVSNAMLKLSDGAAIYAYNENQLTYGTVWRNNIVRNAYGNAEADASPYPDANGLYWDFRCRDMTAEGNTVANIQSNGLFMQYACYNNTIRNNTFYNCSLGAYIYIDVAYTYGGNRIAGNMYYTKIAASDGLYLLDLSSSYHSFGTLDSNTYCNPYNSTAVSRVYAPSSNVLDRLTLSHWQSLTGQDAHAKMMYKKPASYERDTLIINTTGSTATLQLQPYLYHDMYGNAVSVSVTLPPYSSRMLLRDSVKVGTNSPTGTFSASPNSLPSAGGSTTLTWTSSNAASASIDQGIGSVDVNGSASVTVTANKTFTLTVTNAAGVSTRYTAAVTVAAPAPAPAPTGTLAASATTVPSTGGSVTLTWTSANAASASIDQGIGTVALNGSAVVAVTATKTFTLTVTNTAGVTASYAVTITTALSPVIYQTVFSAVKATDAGKGILLSWTTSSESNNLGFDVQRKKGTEAYAKIGYVAGKGNNTVPAMYSYTDNVTKNGTYTYRLRQINTNGTSAYSPETSVKLMRNIATTVSSYPNPFNPAANIVFSAERSGHATMKIFNVIGQEVATLFNGEVEAGVEQIVSFNAASLASGLYFSVLETGGQRIVQKMLYSK